MGILRRSPTVQTLAAFVLVFAVEVVGRAVGVDPRAFALALPLAEHPWTLVVATYAHAGLGHLVANALALLVAGLLVERGTTQLRFHAYFVTTGALAGVAQLYVSAALGRPTAVLGASGAVFALLGYAVVGNRAVTPLLARVDLGRTATLVAFVLVAAAVVLATAGPGVALVAHFAGLLAGLGAGRLRLLRARPAGTARPR